MTTLILAVMWLAAAPRLPAQEQVPDQQAGAAGQADTAAAADSATHGEQLTSDDTLTPDDTLAAEDSLPPAGGAAADSTVADNGAAAGAAADSAAADTTVMDSAAVDGAVADSAAAGTMAADSAAADSLERQAADSLERVRQDVDMARERLGDVRRSLETIPQEDRLRRSPKGAVMRAFALPGWGQLYTGHRMRALLYGGAEVGFATLGFLQQSEVNDFKDQISRERLDFVAQEQAAHPDSLFSREDTLTLFDRFDDTTPGATLQATLESKQKRREDYFTYAIFSVLFAAIDAFVSAHLEPFEGAELRVGGSPAAGWDLGVRVPLGVGPARPGPLRR